MSAWLKMICSVRVAEPERYIDDSTLTDDRAINLFGMNGFSSLHEPGSGLRKEAHFLLSRKMSMPTNEFCEMK